MTHPKSPLPPEWNPAAPLRLSDKVTFLTGWKLRRAAGKLDTCLAAMPRADAIPMQPLSDGPNCGIADRVTVSSVGKAAMAPVETTCAIALRTAIWEHHTLQSAAARIFGENIVRIEHLSSYSCRKIRTPHGFGQRMSLHATAEAIDISGFVLSDGMHISILDDWAGDPDAQLFLREARDGACRWFATTLSPEYNSLHADHFHLQSRGWGLCR